MVVVPTRNPPAPPQLPLDTRFERERSNSLSRRAMAPSAIVNGVHPHPVGPRASPTDREPPPHAANGHPLLHLNQVSLFPAPPGAPSMPDAHGPSPAPNAAEPEREIWALYGAVLELSEQLEKNRTVALELGAQAARLRSQAGHAQAGFPLRRFNMNLSDEVYNTELHQMTRAMRSQNVELVQENRALASLVREHEATLEVVMTKFRNSAHETQQRELALVRSYESRLLVQEAELQKASLVRENHTRAALGRLSSHLRDVWRTTLGEPPPSPPARSSTTTADDVAVEAEAEAKIEVVRETANWALERECELARLERENAELRRMAGQPVPGYPYALDPPTQGTFPYPLSHSRESSRRNSRDVLPPLTGSALSTDGPENEKGPGSPEIGPTVRRLRSGAGVGAPPVRVSSPFAGTGGVMGIGLRLDVGGTGGVGVGGGAPGRRPPRGAEWDMPWGDGAGDGIPQKTDVSREMREALLG